MVAEDVGNMTRGELRSFIEEIIDERTRPDRTRPYRQTSDRPLSEVLEEMRQILIGPRLVHLQ